MSRLSRCYDVIIIGAGSVGVPAALSLSRAGFRVLVLDGKASVGQGSNKMAIGGIRATHSDPAKIRLCLRSIEVLSSWKEATGDDIEWVRGGYTFIAYREKEAQVLRDLLTIQKSYGLNIQWLDAKDYVAIVPGINAQGLIGGTFSPEDGSASPLRTIHSFYRQAVYAGVEFRFNEPVSEMIITKDRVTGVRTPMGDYVAGVIVNAGGSQAQSLAKLAGIDVPVRPDSHEAAITEPVARFLSPMVVDIRPTSRSSNFYFYQNANGQFIFCVTPNPNQWGFNTEETSEFLPAIARRAVELMPKLKNVRIRRTWRGLYPMTPDGFPIVGWSRELEGYMLAVGMCGQGFMLGPGLGELIGRLIEGCITREDQETLRYLSPSRKFLGQEILK